MKILEAGYVSLLRFLLMHTVQKSHLIQDQRADSNGFSLNRIKTVFQLYNLGMVNNGSIFPCGPIELVRCLNGSALVLSLIFMFEKGNEACYLLISSDYLREAI